MIQLNQIFVHIFALQMMFDLFYQGEAIIYQTGTFNVLDNNGCAAPKSITFKEAFDNIPQVVAFFTHYDFIQNAGPLFFHSGITKTKFDVTFICSNPGISAIVLQWIAVDDDRFQFISSFNNDVSNDLSKTFIFPHSNSNHVQKLIGLINFNYGNLALFDFNLDVQMTGTDVTVTFAQTTYNVLSIGFYVILGTSDVFNLGPQKSLTHITVSNELPFTNLPMSYTISYQLPATVDTFRIRAVQQPNTNLTISYFVASWYTCIVQSIIFQEIIIPTNNQIFQPTFFKKMRCVKKFIDYPDVYPIKLRVIEIPNKIITKSNIFTLNSNNQQSTMIISIQCQISTFIQGQFLKCFGCSDQYLNFYQQCYPSINLMEFYITLYQQDQVEQKFKVDITLTSIKVTHLVQNIIGDVPYETIELSLNEV